MNIIAIGGSPRRGNAEFALKRFLTVADTLGHKTELVLLREKRIEHCRGCLSCSGGNPCVILDDIKLIIEQIKRNDLIVFGGPVYFSNVCGLMKDFIDRLNPCYSDKSLSGKKAIALLVGEDLSSGSKAVFAIESLSEAMGLYFIGDVCLSAKNDQDLEKNSEELNKLEEFTNSVLK